MSYFAVERKKINWVGKHTNADKLELATVEGEGNQFVVQKDIFKVGDEVVYFPVDSIIPEDLRTFLCITFLSGAEHNRVKTIKLRGEYSQGLCIPAAEIDKFLQTKNINTSPINDYAPILGITKYEPAAIIEKGGNLIKLPEFLSCYDIESADNYTEVIEYLMDKKVWISEKVEGTNYGVSFTMQDNKFFVNQHHHIIEEIEGSVHTFWKVAREKGLLDLVKAVSDKYKGKSTTIRGELIGSKIQGDYYELGRHDVKLYEIEINGNPVDAEIFLQVMKEFGRETDVVPTIASDITLREWLNGKSIKEGSNGKSLINTKKLREGIVIKPMTEEKIHIGKFRGRLIIKQRSPEYLAKTEY